MNGVADLTTRKLEKNPVSYTVFICHSSDGVSVKVPGVSNTPRGRNAVADVLEAVAKKLREERAESAMQSLADLVQLDR